MISFSISTGYCWMFFPILWALFQGSTVALHQERVAAQKDVPIFHCTFDDDLPDLCQFTNAVSSPKQWIHVRHDNTTDTPAASVPPRSDLTLPDGFLYVDLLNSEPEAVTGELVSRLVTAADDQTDTRYCLELWMFMATHDMTTFRATRLTEEPTHKLDLIVMFGDGDNKWNRKQVDFSSTTKFQVGLQVDVARRALKGGVLAVDEVILHRGYCEADDVASQALTIGEVCNFEEGSCGFQGHDDKDSRAFPWSVGSFDKLSSGTEQTDKLLPSRDSTYHSANGHFALVRFESGSSAANRTKYISNAIAYSGDTCLTFFHWTRQQAGNKISLAVQVHDEAGQYGAVITASYVEETWIAFKYTIEKHPNVTANATFFLHFVAVGNGRAVGTIAVDDIKITNGPCDHPGDCSFHAWLSGTLCGWQNSQDTQMLWESDTYPLEAPGGDSDYLYFEGGRESGNEIGAQAVLYSPDLPAPEQGFECVTFSFFSGSAGAAVLRVHQLNGPDTYTVIWEDYGRIGPKLTWRLGRAPMSVSKTATIIKFEGLILRETDRSYPVAIDEVKFLNQKCTWEPADSKHLPMVKPPMEFPEKLCTFDDASLSNRFCGWKMPVNNGIAWHAETGRKLTVDEFVPRIDHSTLEDYGIFLYFNSSAYNESGSSALAITNTFTRAKEGDPRCLRFWYYLHGTEKVGQLKVDLSPDSIGLGQDPHLWNTSYITGVWELKTTNVPEKLTSFSFIFEGTTTEVDSRGGIALDDVSVVEQGCKPVDCDFEHGPCNWENFYHEDHGDELDWWDGTAIVLPIVNDPTDHGNFLYVPVRDTTPAHDRAWLRHAQLLNGDPLYCLSFQFAFTASGLGQLSVSVESYHANEGQIVWLNDGKSAPGKWQLARVLSNLQQATLIIEVETYSNRSNHGDALHGIAIDDIQYKTVTSPSDCATLPEPEKPSGTDKPPAGTSSTSKPVSTFDCDFEKDEACGWKIPSSESYNWTRMRAGATTVSSGGPMFDHTTNSMNGHYLYAFSEGPKQSGNTARAISPLLDDGQERCLKFYYHVYGPGVGSLRVLTTSETTEDGAETGGHAIWTRHSPDEGNVWQLGQVGVAADHDVRHVIFEAIAGPGKGDIALDGISATIGVCHADDGFCDFEHGRCNFQDVPDSHNQVLSWQILSPASGGALPKGIPKFDATLREPEGHFFTASRVNLANATKALSRTPEYPAEDGKRCFQFYFNIETSGTLGNAFLVTVLKGTGPPVVELNLKDFPSSVTDAWIAHNFQVPIGSAFSVQFEADLSVRAGISIDDVSLRYGDCPHVFDCHFGSDWSCLWEQSKQDEADKQFYWAIISPNSPDFVVGPSTDNTHDQDGKGFMAVATGVKGGYARLISPVIPPNEDMCLTFWYQFSVHEKENPARALRVYGLDPNENHANLFWQLNQDHLAILDTWLFGMTGIKSNVFEQLEFEAELTQHPTSFIALDDIEVTHGVCDTSPEEASPPLTTKRPAATTSRPSTTPKSTVPTMGSPQNRAPVDHPNDLGGGAVAGIVLGTLAFIVILIGAAVFVAGRRASTDLPPHYKRFFTLNGTSTGQESSTDSDHKVFNDVYTGDL